MKIRSMRMVTDVTINYEQVRLRLVTAEKEDYHAGNVHTASTQFYNSCFGYHD